MTEAESSFHLPCFEDDFEKHTEEINDYYECEFLCAKFFEIIYK